MKNSTANRPTRPKSCRTGVKPGTKCAAWFDDGQFAPFVYGYDQETDPRTYARIYTLNEEVKIPLGFFVRGVISANGKLHDGQLEEKHEV